MPDALGSILVVDDEELNRDLLKRRLEMESYTVATAGGGAEALRLVGEEQFDAVLLDIMMPGQSGYEVLAEIRKSQSSIDLPVLMVTAKDQSEDIVNAFEVGANDYITKPIDFPVALARLNCHVAAKKLSTQLRESETRYSLSAQGANDGLWDWDLIADKIHYSPRWKSMLGYAQEEIGDSSQEWFSRVHPEDLPHVEQALSAHRSGQTDQFESEHRMLHQDQTYRWVLTRGVAIRDASGRETRMAGSQTDITRGKAADPLTQLPNRAWLMDHLDAAIKCSQNNPDSLFAVLFLDLDRFKLVNDSLGHHAGDELLVTVAKRLESCLRASDVVSGPRDRCTVARFGGDEFVILINGITKPDNACRVADRMLKVLSEPVSLGGQEVRVSASIGIAIGSEDDRSADDLLRDADTAMYHAKSTGKSRWSLFDPAMRAQVVERLTLEAELRKGLERGEFQVYYQPIVSLGSERIEGLEALLRWQHSTRGLVSPAEFVPIAEETGFIVELGAWVLEQACRQVRTWQLNHPSNSSLFVSVNVSSKQLADPCLAACVTECLQKTGLQAKCLKLEITESSLIHDPQIAGRTLEKLRDIGIHISLDDFGTGYSSLSYLQQFPINTLKIDRSFIQGLRDSSEAEEIVKTIITLAHGLGMEVTAEGIEERSQHSKLHEIACETGQGFLYSRPMPGTSIEELLRDNPQGSDNDRPIHRGSSLEPSPLLPTS